MSCILGENNESMHEGADWTPRGAVTILSRHQMYASEGHTSDAQADLESTTNDVHDSTILARGA